MSSTILRMPQSQSSIAFPSTTPPSSSTPPASTPSSSQHAYTQNSNTAGSPLPIIPRRTSFRSNHPPSLAELSISSNAANTTVPPSDSLAQTDGFPIPIPQPFLDDSDTGSESTAPENSAITFGPSSKRNPPVVVTQASTPPGAGLSAPTPSTNPAAKQKSGIQRRAHPGVVPKRRPGQAANNDSSGDENTAKISLRPPKLKLDLGGLHTRHLSESQINAIQKLNVDPVLALSADPGPNKPLDGTLRKKSGEIVKPSLKSARRPTGIAIPDVRSIFPQSAPCTPGGSKAVHFDSKLEHVKLFLAEQKPLAVSRDGSPTDTSGTESEFPFPSAYGGGTRARAAQKREEEKRIEMRLQSVPAVQARRADVSLQTLAFASAQRAISGRVRVRNLAYEKRVVVRFTLDAWQTTHEVTARYADSFERGVYDDFAFTIRLHDFWTHIEEKTMAMAVRYNVAGKELWDNNAGANYVARFVRIEEPPPPPHPVPGPPVVRHEEEAMIGDLKNKLEQVAKDRRDAPSPTTSFQNLPRRSAERPSSISGGAPFKTRYDFASALRSPWKFDTVAAPRQSSAAASGHARTHTFPSQSSSNNSNGSNGSSLNAPPVPWPSKTSPTTGETAFAPRRGGAHAPYLLPSPRDTEEAAYDRHGAPVWDRAQIEDLPFAAPLSPTTSTTAAAAAAMATGKPSASASPPGSVRSPTRSPVLLSMRPGASPPRERRHRRSVDGDTREPQLAVATLRRTPISSPVDVKVELPFDGVFAPETMLLPGMRGSPLPSPSLDDVGVAALHVDGVDNASSLSISKREESRLPDSYFPSLSWGAPAITTMTTNTNVNTTTDTDTNGATMQANPNVSGSSEDSTPSVTSQSSGASSPVVSPTIDWGGPFDGLSSPPSASSYPSANAGPKDGGYSQFLNRFCFYTGLDSMLEPPPPVVVVPRSASTSDVEGLLWSSSIAPGGVFSSSSISTSSPPTLAPMRSLSWEDVHSTSSASSTSGTSGAATPTGKPASSSSSASSATTPTGG